MYIINKCVICKSQIEYPVQNDLIQIDMFKENNRELTIENSTDAINLYRHETYCSHNKIVVSVFGILVVGVFGVVTWYMLALTLE